MLVVVAFPLYFLEEISREKSPIEPLRLQYHEKLLFAHTTKRFSLFQHS